jgi:hypothetical protein
MTDVKAAETIAPAGDIPAGSVPALPRGQKTGMDLALYGAMIIPQSFGEVVQFAQMMCKAQVAIPKHLRDNPGACMSVIQRSLAWQMDPWAVATKTYAVNDILAYEAQLVAAVVMKWAPIKEKVISPVYSGEGQQRKVAFTLHHRETGEVIAYESPPISQITVKNSPLWKGEPDQQLFYYGIRSMARRHFPGLLLGVYDRDEAMTMRDITPRPADNFLEDKPLNEAGEDHRHETGTDQGPINDSSPPHQPEHSPVDVGKMAQDAREYAEAHGVTIYDPPAEEEHDPETGELGLTQPMTETEVVDMILKSIEARYNLESLNEYVVAQHANILALSGPNQKKVRKAISDKAIDLEDL